jgi:hypothetical protein
VFDFFREALYFSVFRGHGCRRHLLNGLPLRVGRVVGVGSGWRSLIWPGGLPSAAWGRLVAGHLEGLGCQTQLGVVDYVWLGPALRLHQILEDRSIFYAVGKLLSLEINFELRSRLSHQPILKGSLCPELFLFNLNQLMLGLCQNA